jgi:tRNA modification GTPase
MTWDWQETIVAPASAPGGAARGIVRTSGDQVPTLLARCFRPTEPPVLEGASRPRPAAHRMSGHFLAGPPWGEIPCLVLHWPTRRSYTRQVAAEFHLPGSPPLVAAAVETLCRAGARLAEPGEFTLRAFLAGRLDLTQAEAVLGVIQAESDRELAVALQQLGGGLAGPLDALRDRLLNLLAHLEVGLDFVEEDLEFLDRGELVATLAEGAGQVRTLLDRLAPRSRLARAFRVVLRGAPNTGKSSLLNALVGEDRAIVSDEAGTTRDYLLGFVDLEGCSVGLIDTAGVEESVEPGIAEAAQEAASAQLEQAHLELFCLDSSRPPTSWEREQLATSPAYPRLVVLTKCDLADAPEDWRLAHTIRTSSRTGEGMAALRQTIRRQLQQSRAQAEVVEGTALRCEQSLRGALEALEQARRLALASEPGDELIAAELRLALDELGRVVGAVYTDDVLDRIFSRFCIGK